MTSELVSPRKSESKPARELSPEQAAAAAMVAEAKARGLALTGPDGLLKLFTKNVLETALNEEMTEHLGHEKNQADPDRESTNVRNGTRPKTVLSDATGEVRIEVPRDRESTFEPQIVRKRQRRLTDVDEIVLSLYAKGMTTGEISAHFAEIYGASVSKETISRITDKVVAEMNDWANRPLDAAWLLSVVANPDEDGIRMPRYAPNKMPAAVKRRYFQLIRTGMSGAAAAERVGVSLSCGSLWFIDAGRVTFVEEPISPRFLSQDDRIEIADGLLRGEAVKAIAARIGKSYQSVYREIKRNRKPDGRYQPWYAHNQAHVRRRRPKPRRFAIDGALRDVVAGKLRRKWSPAQISRWLRRRYRRRAGWQVCAETIYEAVYRGLIVAADPVNLR